MNKTVDAHTVKAWLDNGDAILVDVRDATEFNEWRIPHASLITANTLNENLAHIQNDGVKVVLHCLSGARSEKARQTIHSDYADNVYQLDGGINAWHKAGFKTIDTRQSRAGIPLMRQVLLTAGLMILTFSALGIANLKAGPYLTAFVGAGLTLAGATGWCGMAMLLSKMPWNR